MGRNVVVQRWPAYRLARERRWAPDRWLGTCIDTIVQCHVAIGTISESPVTCQ